MFCFFCDYFKEGFAKSDTEQLFVRYKVDIICPRLLKRPVETISSKFFTQPRYSSVCKPQNGSTHASTCSSSAPAGIECPLDIRYRSQVCQQMHQQYKNPCTHNCNSYKKNIS